MHSKVPFVLLSALAVAVSASIGGYLSQRIDAGTLPWWSAILSAVLSGAVWGLMCLHAQSLVFASLLYDVVATLTYTVIFLLNGDRLSPVQAVGAVMALIGIALVGAK